MVVDDSAVIRGLITKMIESDPNMNVVVTAPNGQVALSNLDRYDVEIVILDIEMPIMDGLTALPLMLKKVPDLKVIMASTLTLKNAEISMQAMELGATDYVPKPTSSREVSGSDTFKAELLAKVKHIGEAKRKARGIFRPQAKETVGSAARPEIKRAPITPLKPSEPIKISLRQASNFRPEVITIASSTGGPQALFKVFGELKNEDIKQPILITQHMPATFTKILAEHISSVSGKTAIEGANDMIVEGGKIYVAPGGFHMTIKQRGVNRVIELKDTPPENFCKPSADPMLRSVVDIFGNKTFTVVLTGMGNDGSKGSEHVVNAGGTVIAQDEASSVVWGMPGAVAKAGLCSAIMPLTEIPNYIIKHAIRRV
ncbi:MAG: chemotaxis response regulator protein-glutamate methylesterase [Alphaproteobacteria bacterium]